MKKILYGFILLLLAGLIPKNSRADIWPAATGDSLTVEVNCLDSLGRPIACDSMKGYLWRWPTGGNRTLVDSGRVTTFPATSSTLRFYRQEGPANVYVIRAPGNATVGRYAFYGVGYGGTYSGTVLSATYTSSYVVGAATTTNYLANADVSRVNTSAINNLVSGRVDASVGNIVDGTIAAADFAAGAIDAAAIAADAIGSSEIATDAIGAAEIAASAIGTSEWAAEADNNGIDWADVANPTSTVGLTNTTIGTVTTTTTATNVTTVNGLAANVITAASINADAIGASELASDAVTEVMDSSAQFDGDALNLVNDPGFESKPLGGTGAWQQVTATATRVQVSGVPKGRVCLRLNGASAKAVSDSIYLLAGQSVAFGGILQGSAISVQPYIAIEDAAGTLKDSVAINTINVWQTRAKVSKITTGGYYRMALVNGTNASDTSRFDQIFMYPVNLNEMADVVNDSVWLASAGDYIAAAGTASFADSSKGWGQTAAGGGTDWTASERNEIRWRLSMNGTQTDPAITTGGIQQDSSEHSRILRRMWGLAPGNGSDSTTIGQRTVNVQQYLSNGVSASTGGIPDVNVIRINNGLTNGNNATLSLAGLNITNSGGTAVTFASSGGNGHGMTITGNGTGDGLNLGGGSTSGRGLVATGGGTGNGATFQGAANNSGDGMLIQGGQTSGIGIGMHIIAGASASNGALLVESGASTTAQGVHIHQNSASGSSAAMVIESSNGNRDALQLNGTGTGNGLKIAAGSTGDGINVTAAGGDGFDISGGGTGFGGKITAGSGGSNLALDIQNSNGSAVRIQSTGGNGAALTLAGQGTGAGASISGGATANAIAVIAGSTSGDGIRITTTSGDGIDAGSAGAGNFGYKGTIEDTTGINLIGASQTFSTTGSVGSVTGSVGSVAADVNVNSSDSIGVISSDSLYALTDNFRTIAGRSSGANNVDSVIASAPAAVVESIMVNTINANALYGDAAREIVDSNLNVSINDALNLVTNPSFENLIGGTLMGWQTISGNVTRDSTAARSGRYGLKLRGDNTSQGRAMSDTLYIVAGQRIQFGGKIRQAPSSNAPEIALFKAGAGSAVATAFQDAGINKWETVKKEVLIDGSGSMGTGLYFLRLSSGSITASDSAMFDDIFLAASDDTTGTGGGGGGSCTVTFAAGTGANTVTITAKDSSAAFATVSGVFYEIRDTASNAVQGRLPTNQSGIATFSLNNGGYWIKRFKPGIRPQYGSNPSPQDSVKLSVTGTTTRTDTLVTAGITIPSATGVCDVYGFVRTPGNDSNVTNYRVTAKLASTGLVRCCTDSTSPVFTGPTEVEATYPWPGYWKLPLIPSTKYYPDSRYEIIIQIGESVSKHKVLVPDQSNWLYIYGP